MARKKQSADTDAGSTTTTRRIYHVTAKGGEEWLIRAVSQSQAIRCASDGIYSAKAVDPETAVRLVTAGKRVIDASEKEDGGGETA